MHYSKTSKFSKIYTTRTTVNPKLVEAMSSPIQILSYIETNRFIGLWDLAFPFFADDFVALQRRQLPEKSLYVISINDDIDNILREVYGIKKSVNTFLVSYPLSHDELVLDSSDNLPLQWIERICYSPNQSPEIYGNTLMNYLYKPVRARLNEILTSISTTLGHEPIVVSYAPGSMILSITEDTSLIEDTLNTYNAKIQEVGTDECIDWVCNTFFQRVQATIRV